MTKYNIIRFYADDKKPSKIIKSGVSLSEARKHCNRIDTYKPGIWFDGYREQ